MNLLQLLEQLKTIFLQLFRNHMWTVPSRLHRDGNESLAPRSNARVGAFDSMRRTFGTNEGATNPVARGSSAAAEAARNATMTAAHPMKSLRVISCLPCCPTAQF